MRLLGSKRILGRDKWVKWQIIDRIQALRSIQPETALYSQRRLKHYLNTFRTVFVKPLSSFGGKDVIQLRKVGDNVSVVYGKKKLSIKMPSIYDYIERIRKRRAFIVQQGIELLLLKGSPVDLRTIVQLNEQKKWEVTGMFAKVAKKGMVVTNVKVGGKAFPVPNYLKQLKLNKQARVKTIERMKDLSVSISKAFHKQYRNKIYGLDLGLSHNGRLWLIELNTIPSIIVLRRINRDMFLRSFKVYRHNFNRNPL